MPDYQTIRGISTFEYEEKALPLYCFAAFADTEEAAFCPPEPHQSGQPHRAA